MRWLKLGAELSGPAWMMHTIRGLTPSTAASPRESNHGFSYSPVIFHFSSPQLLPNFYHLPPKSTHRATPVSITLVISSFIYHTTLFPSTYANTTSVCDQNWGGRSPFSSAVSMVFFSRSSSSFNLAFLVRIPRFLEE
ncbi:hypothetical protein Dsin_026379 [Dipteronia sinensis]|uniref:Uncharacterized protein n=1 Tax=Dipteronia sinensis TaxID=43782 RepID=A0AAD9ZY32_9ROSI|nr:hypothetical protein Dsin_026379 [Dipteronia sinensis]